jgi:hypothetical protein
MVYFYDLLPIPQYGEGTLESLHMFTSLRRFEMGVSATGRQCDCPWEPLYPGVPNI